MVWQRGGELLESPGRNLDCVDAGGGKTTEVKMSSQPKSIQML